MAMSSGSETPSKRCSSTISTWSAEKLRAPSRVRSRPPARVNCAVKPRLVMSASAPARVGISVGCCMPFVGVSVGCCMFFSCPLPVPLGSGRDQPMPGPELQRLLAGHAGRRLGDHRHALRGDGLSTVLAAAIGAGVEAVKRLVQLADARGESLHRFDLDVLAQVGLGAVAAFGCVLDACGLRGREFASASDLLKLLHRILSLGFESGSHSLHGSLLDLEFTTPHCFAAGLSRPVRLQLVEPESASPVPALAVE